MKRIEPGPISEDTLRSSDLIIKFWETLAALDYDDMFNLEREAGDLYAMAYDNPDALNSCFEFDDAHNWLYCESASWLINDRLFPALEELAGTQGLTFGASGGDGDGACFGFWEELCIRCGEPLRMDDERSMSSRGEDIHLACSVSEGYYSE